MHQLLGARYAGCSAKGLGIAGSGSMMGGGGMIGAYYNSGGSGAMMNSSNWSWMTGGTWQHMSRQDWHQLQQRLLGTSTMNNHMGWRALARAPLSDRVAAFVFSPLCPGGDLGLRLGRVAE